MTKQLFRMKFKFILLTGCFLFALLLWSFDSGQNKVYFIPSLHGLHQINKNYTFDSLKQIISRLNPDIIAVEIRPEDIDQDSTYMKKNYPYEMWMMKTWFPQAGIIGFDWLGDNIEGKPIPNNYWKDISTFKNLERELDKDSIYSAKLGECDTYTNQRLEILKNYSLKEILQSKDSLLTMQFYQCLEEQLKGSKYEYILRFYDRRNEKILKNIKEIIENNNNKVIVIITGDDHYVYLKGSFNYNLLFEN